MFRRVGAGLSRWVCGAPASLPAAAASRSSTIIPYSSSSCSRNLSVLASSTRKPRPLLLSQHQHMPQQQQEHLPLPRGLSTSRDSSAAQHDAEAAEGAALEEGEDGLLEAPKPPRNSLVGVVVSDKMDKSIVVKVSRLKLFLPYMVRKRTFKKIMAHDEANECGVGDIVRVKPSRPLSKRKRFALHEVIRKDPKLTI